MVIGIFGYRWIHRVMQATAVVVGVSLVIMLIQGLRYGVAARPRDQPGPARRRPVPGRGGAAGHRHAVVRPVRLATTPATCPPHTSGRRLFWAIYAGNVLATFFSCAVGAYLAALLPALGPVAAVGKVSGSWALVIMAVSLINANTFNAYTGSFQILAFGSMWRRFKAGVGDRPADPVPVRHGRRRGDRLLGYQSFVTNLTNFLDVLLVIFIPWSAVNLADYFLVRRGRYDVAVVLHPATAPTAGSPGAGCSPTRSGSPPSGRSCPSRTTPARWSGTLGGADISWLVGWFVAAVVYLLLASGTRQVSRPGRPAAAPVG